MKTELQGPYAVTRYDLACARRALANARRYRVAASHWLSVACAWLVEAERDRALARTLRPGSTPVLTKTGIEPVLPSRVPVGVAR